MTQPVIFRRADDADGRAYTAWLGTNERPYTTVYHTGRRWRATGTRGAFATRREAAQAALAQAEARVQARVAAWQGDAHARLAARQ